MFRRVIVVFGLLAVVLVPLAARAQEEEAPRPYSYATYSECALSGQWRADEIAESVFAPAYDAALAEGKITGWGYLAHHTGGKWRRVVYHSALSTDALLDALDWIGEKTDEANARAAAQYSKICSAHDDYIWRWVTGSGPAEQALQDRGAAGFSVYYVCAMDKEDRADELVKEAFAAAYNRQVEKGNLNSWGWLQHWVGGKWRRLEVMSAADHKTVLKARDEIIAELLEKQEGATKEFNSICSSHQDYLWDIKMEKP